MQKFKAGDEVVFTTLGTIGWEKNEWWRQDGLILNEKYVVEDVTTDAVCLQHSRRQLQHHPDHFTLATEIKAGDKVRIKSWEEQIALDSFNEDDEGDWLPRGWIRSMIALCGEEVEVLSNDGSDCLPLCVRSKEDALAFWLDLDQVELVDEKQCVPASETPLEASETAGDLHTQLEDVAEAPGPVSEAIKSDGGSSVYYTFTITNAYGESMEVETGDVIRAMVGNDFDFGNCIKALRRMYLVKSGKGGKLGTDVSYDANKIRWFVDQIEKR